MPDRPDFTELELTIVDFLRDVYGGAKPSGKIVWDAAEEHYINFAFFWATEDKSTEAVSTVGLAAHSIYYEEGEIDRAVELTGVHKESGRWLAGVLAECAFRVMRDGERIEMGTVFRELDTLEARSKTLRHVLFVPPLLMPGDFDYGLLLENGVTVKWLQAIPVSEDEHEFILENDDIAIMNIINQEMVDIRDVNRPSMV